MNTNTFILGKNPDALKKYDKNINKLKSIFMKKYKYIEI